MSKIIDIYKSALVHRYDDEGYKKFFTQSDFEGLNKKDICFLSKQGNTLRGGIYYYKENSDCLVIFCHGIGEGLAQYMREIELLANYGFEVLAYDNTGCNTSDGQDIIGLSQGLSDLISCVDYVSTSGILKGRKVYVVGHSWEGYAASNINNFRRVNKVVSISGFISVKTMICQMLKGVAALFRSSILNCEKANNPECFNSSAIDALNKKDSKALLIHSLDDNFVSAKKNTLYLQEKITNPNVKFIITDKKGHNPNYTFDGVSYMTEVFSALNSKVKSGELKTPADKKDFLKDVDWWKMTNQDQQIFSSIIEFLNS